MTQPPQPPEQQHPLGAARLRHQRSRECLRDIENQLLVFGTFHDVGDPVHGPPLAYQDPDTGEWKPLPDYKALPIGIVFRTSEMLYNLKVSLDYVMYALLVQACGEGRISRREYNRIEDRVQFPIMDTPQKLRTWREKHWQWLRPEERASIRRAQPYKRKFMRLLGADYHNLDKHRELQPMTVEIDLGGAQMTPTGAVIGPPGLIWQDIPVYGFHTEGLPDGSPVNVYSNSSISISLLGGLPLVETLQVLESEVGALINAFGLVFE